MKQKYLIKILFWFIFTGALAAVEEEVVGENFVQSFTTGI